MKKINLYTFPDYKKHIQTKTKGIYIKKITDATRELNSKHTQINIYDKTHNPNKRNNEIIYINNHINKSGTNPLLKQKNKSSLFYDISEIYIQTPRGIITTCLGKRYDIEKTNHENPCSFLPYIAIFLYVKGYKKIHGRLINVK